MPGSKQFEGQRRAVHRLAPTALVFGFANPGTPVIDRFLEGSPHVSRIGRIADRFIGVFEHKGSCLAGLQGEFADDRAILLAQGHDWSVVAERSCRPRWK